MPLFSKVQTSALAAAVLASAALFAPAASAQQQHPAQPISTERGVGQLSTGSNIIVLGAIKDPSDRGAARVEDRAVPELPVVYEDAKAPAPASPRVAAAPPASAARR